MREYVFAWRQNSIDRDCNVYVDTDKHLDIGNRVITQGACYCGRPDGIPYEDVETFLTESEYNLMQGVIEGDDIEKYSAIVDKLASDEAREWWEQNIIPGEIEYLMGEYNLDEDEVKELFDEYNLPYRDRGIIGCVYDNTEDLGREYADDILNIPDNLRSYFDYERFGDDLANDEGYTILADNRVVSFNY